MVSNLKSFDLSVYLVTDRSLTYPDPSHFLRQIELAIQGGVTIVQLREKLGDDDEIYDLALQVKALCQRYNVTFIINDRVDLAKRIDADGVHVGQEDMAYIQAREILGSHKIVGVSVGTPEEAEIAVTQGVDYVGIGAAYSTQTKNLKRFPLGPEGVAKMLSKISSIPAVVIGGINLSNLDELLGESYRVNSTRKLDGVAVVSALMASPQPDEVAKVMNEKILNYSQN